MLRFRALFHHTGKYILAFMIGVLFVSLVACSKTQPPTVQPTRTKTPKPTFTQRAPSSTLVPLTKTPTPPPTATPRPTNTPEPTVELTESPTESPTEEPSATPLPPTAVPKEAGSDAGDSSAGDSAAAGSAAQSSAGSVSSKPKGSPLAFEPEFPGVSPASEPPGHDEHTNPLSGQHVDSTFLPQSLG